MIREFFRHEFLFLIYCGSYLKRYWKEISFFLTVFLLGMAAGIAGSLSNTDNSSANSLLYLALYGNSSILWLFFKTLFSFTVIYLILLTGIINYRMYYICYPVFFFSGFKFGKQIVMYYFSEKIMGIAAAIFIYLPLYTVLFFTLAFAAVYISQNSVCVYGWRGINYSRKVMRPTLIVFLQLYFIMATGVFFIIIVSCGLAGLLFGA